MHLVNATAVVVGATSTEISVRERWGPRFVIRGDDGKEHIVWGKDIFRCRENPHSLKDPYDAKEYHKWNRRKLRKIHSGSLIKCRVRLSSVPPAGCAATNVPKEEWKPAKVLRVIRSGCFQHVDYTVASSRCINDLSVKLSKRMLTRARRDNKLWGSGHRPPATLTERHVVTAATYNHLRDWIFDTDFLEILKATEQATQRGHCFAIREAAEATHKRYKASAQKVGVSPVPIRVYRCETRILALTQAFALTLALTLVLTLNPNPCLSTLQACVRTKSVHEI